MKHLLKGKGRPAAGAVYPLSRLFDPTLAPYPYAPKRALALLAEAGWRDRDGDHLLDREGKPFTFDLAVDRGNATSEQAAALIQQQLFDLGIRVRVTPLPLELLIQRLLQGEFQGAMVELSAKPDALAYQWFHSSQIGGGFNVFFYRNRQVDEALAAASQTADLEGRKRLYSQFQHALFEDPPGIFLFWRDYFMAIHRRFRGVKPNPGRSLWNIEEWWVPKEEQRYRE